MKHIAKLTAAVLLVSVLLVALVSCSAYGTIESNFKSEGYEVVQVEDNTIAASVAAAFEDKEVSCTAHLFKKTDSLLDYVLILEFGASDELVKAIEGSESETIKGLISDISGGLQQSQFVRDNCFCVPLNPLSTTKVLEIFNK